jgi:hypothetical protein
VSHREQPAAGAAGEDDALAELEVFGREGGAVLFEFEHEEDSGKE